MNVLDEPISTENSVKKWEMFVNKWKSVSNVEFFRSKSCAIKTVLTCKTLAVWTYTYYRLEEFVTPARGVTSIKVTNRKRQVFAIPAREISSMNFSARLVKQAWSRDGNSSVLLILIKGYYYVLAPLGGNKVRLFFRNGDLFLTPKTPIQVID